MKNAIKIFLAFAALSFTSAAFAITADEVVAKAEQAAYYQGKDGKAKVTMDISDGRQRKFVILRKNYGKDQKFYVYFERPSDVRKTTFLVHKNKDGNDDRWMYLPALDLVKRIAAGDKRTSFMGSNFFYEDVSGRNPADDTHELVETDKNFYVLKSTPKNPASAEFAYYKTWIHKESFIPVKTSYYDKAGKEYRTYQALKVEDVGGFKTVTSSVMKDLQSGSQTTLTYGDVKYNLGLEDDIFTERYLKAPAQKWLK